MSRSRKKYHTFQWVSGNDRPFKIEGRRILRSANKRMLRNLLSNKDIETVSDEVYNLPRVGDMDPWGWPSEGTNTCFYGSEEKYLKWRENNWLRFPHTRASYKSKAAYMTEMKKRYRKMVRK